MENRKVYLNKHSNLLQLEEHMYPSGRCGYTKRVQESVSL